MEDKQTMTMEEAFDRLNQVLNCLLYTSRLPFASRRATVLFSAPSRYWANVLTSISKERVPSRVSPVGLEIFQWNEQTF